MSVEEAIKAIKLNDPMFDTEHFADRLNVADLGGTDVAACFYGSMPFRVDAFGPTVMLARA